MIKIHIDEAIAFHNKKVDFLDSIQRIQLGKIIMPEYSEMTIHKTLSNWSNGIMIPTPSPEDLCKISEVTGVSVDQLLGLKEINLNK